MRTGLTVAQSLYVWTVTTLIVRTHARFWSISSSLLSQLFIALQSEKQWTRQTERERETERGTVETKGGPWRGY